MARGDRRRGRASVEKQSPESPCYLIPIFEIVAFTRTRMTHFRDEKAEDDGDIGGGRLGHPTQPVTRGRMRERFDAVYFPSRKPTMRLLFA